MINEKFQARMVGDANVHLEIGPFTVVTEDWQRESMGSDIWLDPFKYLKVKSGPSVVLLGRMGDKFLLTVNFRPTTVGTRQQGFPTEALAGRVNHGETAEKAIKREFREEIKGLRIKEGTLKRVFSGYSSPGILDELLIFYIADLEQDEGWSKDVSGLADEGEEVMRYFASLDEILDAIKSEEIQDAKLIALAYFVALREAQEILVDKEVAISHIPGWLRRILNWWYKIHL